MLQLLLSLQELVQSPLELVTLIKLNVMLANVYLATIPNVQMVNVKLTVLIKVEIVVLLLVTVLLVEVMAFV